MGDQFLITSSNVVDSSGGLGSGSNITQNVQPPTEVRNTEKFGTISKHRFKNAFELTVHIKGFDLIYPL